MSIDFDKIHQSLKIDDPVKVEKKANNQQRSVKTRKSKQEESLVAEKPKDVEKEDSSLTRRTFKYPAIYDYALNELQDRENIRRRRLGERGKFNSEDTIALVFEKFFAQTEYAECLRAAEEKFGL
jgi:hypothetical protein